MSATSCAERDCCGCFLAEMSGFLPRATCVLRKRMVNAIFYSYSYLDARPCDRGRKMPMTTSTTPKQKNLLLIGASRGLGLAMAEAFLERGWNIVGTVR